MALSRRNARGVTTEKRDEVTVMWVSTSKGKTLRHPSATDLVGALVAAAPDEAVVVARDLMHFVYAWRQDAVIFAVWVRDGSHVRQVRVEHDDVRDVASAFIAFATHASFARDLVDAMTAT